MAKTQKVAGRSRVTEVNLDKLKPLEVRNPNGVFVTCGRCGESMYFRPEVTERECNACGTKVIL